MDLAKFLRETAAEYRREMGRGALPFNITLMYNDIFVRARFEADDPEPDTMTKVNLKHTLKKYTTRRHMTRIPMFHLPRIKNQTYHPIVTPKVHVPPTATVPNLVPTFAVQPIGGVIKLISSDIMNHPDFDLSLNNIYNLPHKVLLLYNSYVEKSPTRARDFLRLAKMNAFAYYGHENSSQDCPIVATAPVFNDQEREE